MGDEPGSSEPEQSWPGRAESESLRFGVGWKCIRLPGWGDMISAKWKDIYSVIDEEINDVTTIVVSEKCKLWKHVTLSSAARSSRGEPDLDFSTVLLSGASKHLFHLLPWDAGRASVCVRSYCTLYSVKMDLLLPEACCLWRFWKQADTNHQLSDKWQCQCFTIKSRSTCSKSPKSWENFTVKMPSC